MEMDKENAFGNFGIFCKDKEILGFTKNWMHRLVAPSFPPGSSTTVMAVSVVWCEGLRNWDSVDG